MKTSHRRIPFSASSMSLRTRFRIGIALILLVVCFISALLIYYREKTLLEESAYLKTELVMAAVEASRAYVREELRPRMYSRFGEDFFMLEAMSTSYVGRAVMDRFGSKRPDFLYRRVSVNARNPDSEANTLQMEMIRYFRENPDRKDWQGLAGDNGSHYMRFQPVYFEDSCMHCHGDAGNAPPELINQYGDTKGFGHYPGELAGLITVGIPVHSALFDIRERATSVFMAVFFGVSLFFLFLIFFFDRIVVNNLRGVLNLFREELDKDDRPEIPDEADSNNEIQVLTSTAMTIAEHLRHGREILEQKNLALEQKKELLQSVFNGITDMVVLMDRDFKIKMVNKAYLERNGVALEDVYDQPCYEVHTGSRKPCSDCVLEDVAASGKAVSKEIMNYRGELFLVHFYPVMDESGRLENIIRYSREITDQKKVELKIQQAEKLVAMGQLAAGVAHEINNPLGVILCYVDLLKRALADFPQGLKDVAVIEKQALNSKRIVSDLLQFARSHVSAKQMTGLNHLINEVVQLLAHQFKKQKVKVILQLSEEIPQIYMDVNKIKQVLINLLMNACQAVDGDGEITIASEWLPARKQAEIKILDNGQGVDHSIKARIFDPFFTTKPNGQSTGLGLSVSYGIIQDHGGELTVDSAPGQLTCFTVRLPLIDQKRNDGKTETADRR